MVDDDGPLLAERVEKPDRVADEVELRLLVGPVGALGLAVASLVGSHGVVARVGQRPKLVPPRKGF